MIGSTKKSLLKKMANAKSYDEWKELAQTYDRRAGLERWRLMDQSRRYDYVSIRSRLDSLRHMRARHDHRGLLFTLNEGIHGNMCGMGNHRLYTKAKFGTKQVIGDYVDEITDALKLIADPQIDDISFDEKLDFFRRAHHCFGRSAFMMSGSGSLLYFHLGVVKALWEQRLLPSIISGASGGAFVGSFISSHTDSELERLFQPENLAYEEEGNQGFLRTLRRLIPERMHIDEIKFMLDRLQPDLTFAESYELTGRLLNVSVAPLEAQQSSRLLNAVTSPNVYLRDAILASGAVPGVYPPVTLAAKNDHGERQAYLPSRKWIDGSISEDLPAKRLARLYGVNHYIVSQTNPLVTPFLADNNTSSGALSKLRDSGFQTARLWLNTGADVFHKPLSKAPMINNAFNSMLSLINQNYQGDINIVPQAKFANPYKVLSNLSVDEISKLMLSGERSAWPHIEKIRIQTKIGNTLDAILQEYEEQYVSSATVNFRRKAAK